MVHLSLAEIVAGLKIGFSKLQSAFDIAIGGEGMTVANHQSAQESKSEH